VHVDLFAESSFLGRCTSGNGNRKNWPYGKKHNKKSLQNDCIVGSFLYFSAINAVSPWPKFTSSNNKSTTSLVCREKTGDEACFLCSPKISFTVFIIVRDFCQKALSLMQGG
jgi:hypothetical protein